MDLKICLIQLLVFSEVYGQGVITNMESEVARLLTLNTKPCLDVIEMVKGCDEDYRGTTVLQVASSYGYLPLVRKLLIEDQQDVDDFGLDDFKRSALHYVALSLNDHTNVAKFLIKNGATINAIDKDENTPLHLAAMSNIGIANILIENGANINAQNNDGRSYTPLHVAAWASNSEMVNILIDQGAKTDVTDNGGQTALDTAKIYGKENIKLIIKKIESKFKGVNVCHRKGVGIGPGSGGCPCRDDWKGDGECDDVNDTAECNYDYGDCCKKDWIGDGKCDAKNNFLTCNTTPDTPDVKAGRYDGGDCHPRKCFADENDPLDIAFTAKYGKTWYDKIRGDHALVNGTLIPVSVLHDLGSSSDEQSFFPEILNTNECRALNCFLIEGQCQSDSCWKWDGSWNYEFISCDTKILNDYDGNHYELGRLGCYCKATRISVEHECCLDSHLNTNRREVPTRCITDLNSSQHPCNIKGVTWDDKEGPILPGSDIGSCCRNGDIFDFDENYNFNHNLPCQVICGPTYSFFNAANRIKNSGGGRPRG